MGRAMLEGVLAIVSATLGLLIIAVFYEVAIEMSEAWWQWLVGLTIATGLALVGLAMIYAAIARTVGAAAAGWLGMLSGRVPHGFAGRDGNAGRALGQLVLFGAALYLGLRLFRVGRLDGELNWAIEGLFLCAAGVAFGLLPAIPRLYFARLGRGDPVGQPRPRGVAPSKSAEHGDGVTVLVTCALLGIALSMCAANTVFTVQARDGEATLPYADWIRGCIDPESELAECPGRATLTLVPRRVTRLRIESLTKCHLSLTTAEGEPVEVLGYAARKELGIPTAQDEWSRHRIVFDPRPGVTYRIELKPTADQSCTYSLRYLDEPTGPGEVRP